MKPCDAPQYISTEKLEQQRKKNLEALNNGFGIF